MRQRALGGSGLDVGAIGLGCMPLSAYYGDVSPSEAHRALDQAVDSGMSLWDTAEIYGNGANEELLAPVLRRRREDIVVATKFGLRPDGSVEAGPVQAQAALEGSLLRLGVEHIDLWFVHRVDPHVPIEDTIGAMADAVAAGKVRALGLCEASADTLRRAHAEHPLAAVQSEWSLWSRDIEADVLPAARELGIAIVPYSPLGRGMLTSSVRHLDALDEDDHRRSSPRFSPENFASNRALSEDLLTLARERGCTSAQLALAWLLAHGDDIVPIPGTRSHEHVVDNAAASDIVLSPAERDHLSQVMSHVQGARYARPHAYGDSPAR